jgi:NCS1 nucleoside transporter family
MDTHSYNDEEKGVKAYSTDHAPVEAIREDEIRNRFARFGPLGKLFDAGVEARGIERVPEDERDSKHAVGLMLLWFSVNTVATTIPIGLLAQAFYTLTYQHSIATIFGFSAIGSATVAFIATLGPMTGLRTMVISRYAGGYCMGTVFALANILTQLGFSVIAVILGGSLLNSVNHKFPLVVAVIIIGILSVLICFIGYSFLHHYERYAWIILTAIIIMMYVLGYQAGYDLTAQAALEDPPGHLRAADILSFGGIIFSSSAGWAPIAADFNCRLPATISKSYVFALTWIGLMLPLIFVESLGVLLMTVPSYAAAYTDGDAGALIKKVFEPWGKGGDFIVVLLGLSVIANNIPNTYSAGLSMQALLPWFRLVPRAFWTILAFVIYTVAGVAGREHFSSVLSNFLAILGYWVAIFVVVLAEEHFIFRRPGGKLGGYNLEVYDSFRRLPVGLAAAVASACGVAGAVVGMAEVWYIGPIGAKLGPFGGDLGFELAAAFAGIAYAPLRYLEINYFGR